MARVKRVASRAMRNKRNAAKGFGKGNSRYAQKVASGNQMYGSGDGSLRRNCDNSTLIKRMQENAERKRKQESRRE